jgi:signal transduction histidine kinase
VRLPAFLDRSVRRKLTAIVVATTLAALVVTAVALIAYNLSDYRERTLADVRTQAEIVGRAAAPAIAFNDPQEAAKDLAMLDAREDVVQAALYTKDGRLFASFADNGDTSTIPAWASGVTPGIDGERLTLFYPIVEGGQPLGAVVLVTNYGLRARFSAYLLILGGVMALALVAALLLSSWLQRALSEPILQLADAARAVVERRDFSVRAGKTTDDEIGVLADAMNRMLADLEREIKERRGAEEALRVQDQRKDEFLATLAHELRNPLAPVKNALYLMQLTEDPKTLAESKAIIDRQMRQMVRLVDDLLEVSRITTGRLALRREVVELRNVAKSALEAVEPIMRERGQHLTSELPPAGLTITADPTRLAQVFINLLGNASKFTDPGGRIEFLLEVREGEMVARVRDNGVGLAPGTIESIFEMFAQVDRSLERNASGLGVGLSISRKLIELHGGTLEARSDGVGQGAEFTVRIPAGEAEKETSELEEPGVTLPASAEHRPRVLVVDDNKDFALSLGKMVQAMGYEVRVEHDGLAGLAAAEAIHPRIAFLDIGMPKLNGYELARRLRAIPATAACILIAVTGWGQASDRQRAREAGFDEHIVKPLELDRLQKLLGRI